MVWFVIKYSLPLYFRNILFQTKLTYGMICYKQESVQQLYLMSSFKLSWLMVWFVIKKDLKKQRANLMFQTKLTYGMICYVSIVN